MVMPIDEVWTAVAKDANGQEQVCLFLGHPLIVPDLNKVADLYKIAEIISANEGVEVTIVRFTRREDVTKVAASRDMIADMTRVT